MSCQIVDDVIIKWLIKVDIASAAMIIANLLDQINQIGSARKRFVRNVDIHIWDSAEYRTLEHSNPQLVKIAEIDGFVRTHVE